MAKNTLVINCDIGETRVALIENGILSELHVERKQHRGLAGNIYLGKISRVLPGMQAAFIDIGEERAAFLHVEDLIRPADFEAYLAHTHEGTTHAVGETETLLTSSSPALEDTRSLSEISEEPRAEDPELTIDTHTSENDPVIEDQSTDEFHETSSVEPYVEPENFAQYKTEPSLQTIPYDESSEERIQTSNVDEKAQSSYENTELKTDVEPSLNLETSTTNEPILQQETTEMALPEGWDRPRLDFSWPSELSSLFQESSSQKPTISPEPSTSAEPFDFASTQLNFEPQGSTHPHRGTRAGQPERSRRGSRNRFDRTRSKEPMRGEPRAHETESSEKRPHEPREPLMKSPMASRGPRDSRNSPTRSGRTRINAKKESKEGGLKLERSTPINEVVREGQEVIVQVTKDPIGTKGARVSSHLSLSGRYVVYMPTVEHFGVSRRIGSEFERRRLREVIEAIKPPKGGLIVRTVAEGLTKKQLKADIGYLVRLWGEIVKKRDQGTVSPALLFQELDLVLRTARDLFTEDIEKIVIDDREQFLRLQRFVEIFMPERVKAIEFYAGKEPIFDAYGIEDEITRALSRRVPLPSGGYLIIDQAEALTAIDVNSGRFVGKGNKDPEDTILQTNLEAVQEIAYQLRFRNIGGLIVLDLIDMEKAANREKVYRALEQAVLADKAKTSINRISELGLVEMTRKRTRESLGRTLHERCFYCDGTGQLQARTTIAYEILRQIRRERTALPGYKIIVNAHPFVIETLKTEEQAVLKEAERRYQRQIMLVPHREYHMEQFEITSG